MLMEISGKLASILYDPSIIPIDWCLNQPCIDLGFVVISQPSSSILVYLASIIPISIGIYYIKNQDNQKSRFWLGLSLILVGLGAGLAGTSYQAFGYEIKCSGNEFCVWTSWWELAYNLCTILGADTLLYAISYSSLKNSSQKRILLFSSIHFVTYNIILFFGGFTANQFLVSFEVLMLFVLPVFIIVLFVSLSKYIKNRDELSKTLLIACLLLFLALVSYYIYSMLGYTEELWVEKGIWFSDNDVLHILMILWVLYIRIGIGKKMIDVEN